MLLQKGMHINIFKDGNRVDAVIVCNINLNDPHRDEVTVRSILPSHPREEKTYASFGDHWKEVFSDPMDGIDRCYSPEESDCVFEIMLEPVLE